MHKVTLLQVLHKVVAEILVDGLKAMSLCQVQLDTEEKAQVMLSSTNSASCHV